MKRIAIFVDVPADTDPSEVLDDMILVFGENYPNPEDEDGSNIAVYDPAPKEDWESDARDLLADLDEARRIYDLATDDGNRETVGDYEDLEDSILTFAENAENLLRNLIQEGQPS